MNDNIKRLALLCGAWTQVYENKFGQKLMMIDANFDYEKFAELIVQECMQVCLQQRDPTNLNYKPSEQFTEALKQHFGVY